MTDQQRFIVIMTMIICLGGFGAAVALGHVEEKTSYGLTGILLILGQIASGVVKSEKNRDPDIIESVPVQRALPAPPVVVERGGFGESGKESLAKPDDSSVK